MHCKKLVLQTHLQDTSHDKKILQVLKEWPTDKGGEEKNDDFPGLSPDWK